ncbi:hypothetical protein MIN45_P0231 [Methylomarinovum tepidoasis]|uniref:Bacterial sugar transferase domain-containing protein n=1 Tax=Methylomarinovum tepidoasis TaxID=2840183 RepID=A0AAU9CYY8_9GAMM|nr:TIGR03013 family XrtA/PEP-CTERM system glycosyltransferase [Methylomarinovum sp. IN45]BCX87864.1 hypothetical protein MIN45_P0231 [Methylomarinovum sp. IN45]
MPTIRIFRHYVSTAYLGLMVVEFLLYLGAIYIGGSLRFLRSSDWRPEDDWLLVAFLFAATMLVCNVGAGLYQRAAQWNAANLVLRLGVSIFLAAVAMSLVFYAFPELFVGRGVFGFALLVSFTTTLLLRYLFYRLVDNRRLRRRILVLGAGDKARKILDFRRRLPYGNLTFAGFVRMGQEDCRVPAECLVSLDVPLREFAAREDIDEIVVAPDDRRRGFPVDEILDCKMSGFDVVDLLTFFEREAGIVKIDCLHPSWLVFSDGFRMKSGMLVKRLFDIGASLALLAVAWPVMLATAAAIKIESRGRHPVFYRQTRVGEDWRLFQVLKFRSMRPDAEKDGVRMAKANDDRVTRVGRFIRKTRIDELPQLWNVFRGDMSFVGPRPERPEFVERFAETIPYYSERHRVRPGITGWAQVCYPYAENEADTLEKLQYDLYYVKNYSLFLDFLILLRTVEVVLWGKGAR